MTSVDVQVAVLLVTVLLGAAVGLAYDVYRGLRRVAGRKRAATFAGDLLFWVAATILVFRGLIFGNGGELRSYVFVGAAVGLYLYFELASQVVLWGSTWFWRSVLALGRFVVGFLLKIARTVALIWGFGVGLAARAVGGGSRTVVGRLTWLKARWATWFRRRPPSPPA